MAQATPIQPVRSTVTVETRAMASIRPMAISPATSSASSSVAPSTPSSQTPMATVHPTTQEGEGMMSPLHVSTQGRPTQTVQPVSPHVEESSEFLDSFTLNGEPKEFSHTKLYPKHNTSG